MPAYDPATIEALRQQFHRDGFLALEGYFSEERIEALKREVELQLAARPEEIVVDNQLTRQRSLWVDAADREHRRFKFNDLYLVSEVVRRTALDQPLARLLNALLGAPAVLCNSLNFQKGSGDAVHIDSLFMTPRTPGGLAATWTALEDVHPDSGPLVYYPGSHRIPLYRFKDGSHHMGPGERPAWNDYIHQQLRDGGYPEKVFLARKGDVFIWASDLVHAGRAIADQNRTRNSFVCHYYTEPDCRAMGCELVPCHDAYWMHRLPQAVTVPPETYRTGRRFPEEQYLSRHPDVRSAVHGGSMASGWVHYEAFGHKEGRGV